MQELLSVLVTWLAVSLGLPGVYDHPEVKRASADEMSELRLDRVEAERQAGIHAGEAACPACRTDLVAMYDDETRTIYLPREWTGTTPAETSILVHELVHHLQNVAQLSYDCGEAREKPAYVAQARWLELFGTSLEREFRLDPMTMLVRTNCMH